LRSRSTTPQPQRTPSHGAIANSPVREPAPLVSANDHPLMLYCTAIANAKPSKDETVAIVECAIGLQQWAMINYWLAQVTTCASLFLHAAIIHARFLMSSVSWRARLSLVTCYFGIAGAPRRCLAAAARARWHSPHTSRPATPAAASFVY
jgi:hypothetical protein